MTTLIGKVAIVTGAAQGIGRAIATRLGALGARVVVNHLDQPDAAEAVAAAIVTHGSEALAVDADIARVERIDHLFEVAQRRFGRIDIVVANAALQGNMPVADVTEAAFDRMFAVNVKGAYFTLQRAARHVADGGRIVYIGSSTTNFPMMGHGLYGASKMPCRFLVEVLAKEIGHRRVTVNSILPTVTQGGGPHSGELTAGAAAFIKTYNPQGRPGSLEDVANTCEYLVSDLASFVSGQHLLVSAGAPA